MAQLCDVCSLITDGSHFSPEDEGAGYPMLSVKDMQDTDFDFRGCKHIGAEAFQKLVSNGCRPLVGDVVVAKDGSYLKTAFPITKDRDIALLSSIAILRPNPAIVTSEYLSYYLKSPSVYRTVSLNYITGTALKRIILAGIRKLPIELPSLGEQKRRADLLDTIYRIIQSRQRQLHTLDTLIKARFVEMFGDRWSNDKEWPISTLGEVADFYNGKPHEQVIDENGEYILVTSRCIASEGQEVRRTNELLFPLETGDICMVMSDVPNGKALAKCMYIDCDGRYSLNQRICCFRNYRYNPRFLFYLLNRHEYLLSYNDGDSQTNLRKGDLLSCPMIIPPLELQNQFSAFVSQVDKSKLSSDIVQRVSDMQYNVH